MQVDWNRHESIDPTGLFHIIMKLHLTFNHDQQATFPAPYKDRCRFGTRRGCADPRILSRTNNSSCVEKREVYYV